MKMFTLEAIYSTVKSHYGKAHVIHNDDTYYLRSYETIVAEYNTVTQELVLFGLHSNTTKRHIHDFMNQFTPYKIDAPHIKHLTKYLRHDIKPSLTL